EPARCSGIHSRYNRVLSFFHFPADEELRRQWIVAIRRENLAIKAHTRVCSRHFKPEDIKEPASETGRRRLKKGAVPALFEWNNYSVPRPGVWERRQRPPPEGSGEEDNMPTNATVDVLKEHDYASPGRSPPATGTD
uniref:THAP domain-containing protein 1 n=1 Tax=Amphilophus citrinellus TaxID=61819 RepID=A0A3Q0R0A9_AMPCI